MQIQLWERIGVSRGEAASWSTPLHAASQETGKGEHGSAGLTLKRLPARICFAARRKGGKRQDMRGRVGWRGQSSCGRPHPGRRAKEDFGSREPFDDLHGSATLGAAIKIRRVFLRDSVPLLERFLCSTQQLEANRQGVGAPSASQETEVPDGYEALRIDGAGSGAGTDRGTTR